MKAEYFNEGHLLHPPYPLIIALPHICANKNVLRHVPAKIPSPVFDQQHNRRERQNQNEHIPDTNLIGDRQQNNQQKQPHRKEINRPPLPFKKKEQPGQCGCREKRPGCLFPRQPRRTLRVQPAKSRSIQKR